MGADRGTTRLLLQGNLRRRWRSLVVVALVAGLGTSAALAAVAGARRTVSAPARLYTERRMPDAMILGRGVMSWLVAGLAVLTVGFGLLLTVRQRRRELGVLQALGLRPCDARGAVHWQGIVTAVAGLAVGLPAGPPCRVRAGR